MYQAGAQSRYQGYLQIIHSHQILIEINTGYSIEEFKSDDGVSLTDVQCDIFQQLLSVSHESDERPGR